MHFCHKLYNQVHYCRLVQHAIVGCVVNWTNINNIYKKLSFVHGFLNHEIVGYVGVMVPENKLEDRSDFTNGQSDNIGQVWFN